MPWDDMIFPRDLGKYKELWTRGSDNSFHIFQDRNSIQAQFSGTFQTLWLNILFQKKCGHYRNHPGEHDGCEIFI